MKIQIPVAVDNYNNWRAHHLELGAIDEIGKLPYSGGRRVHVVWVDADVPTPPSPPKVDGEIAFCHDTVELLRKARDILHRHRLL